MFSLRTSVFYLLWGSATAMVDLTHEMLTARTLEDFEAAQKKHANESGMGKELRQRSLAEQGLEDSKHILADMFEGVPGFYHGVASGDPLNDAVIVWTRFTPTSADDTVDLELRMAKVDPSIEVNDHLDPSKNEHLHRVKVTVTSETDFIAKIDVTGLEAGANYVFAFSDGTTTSPIGNTKIAPGPQENVESMVYAVFSCSHYANGYFHAYDIASTIKDLDFWVHVGDYVYEYGLYSSYASDSPERKAQILPEWEQISLQDHRNRMATYHLDEGLRNLRARAPLIACWDDHETANNPYGDGTEENTGAENHQETCPVNSTSPDAEKEAAECDRDEGSATRRFNGAFQAYLEWMPLRRYEGSMGVVTLGAINQVISWGDMATIVTFDTRVSHRSEDPTVNGNTFGPFVAFAGENMNVSEYSTTLLSEVQDVASPVHELLEREEFTMIGQEGVDFLKSSLEASKTAGQPWQIWATATAVGRAVKGDYSKIHTFVEDPTTATEVKAATDAIFASPNAAFFRALTAQAVTSTPWNRDDFSGFAHEQRQILDVVKAASNNPIILAGDLHDSYAWTLYEGGEVDGTPCAVNLVGPGVTSPGWGPTVASTFSSLASTLGGEDAVYDITEQADEAANPGLKYFNHQYKGFFAVRATKEEHTAEFFAVTPETILTDYDTARTASGSIVADFKCDAQLTTTAGMPGSLTRSDECGAVQFDSTRPGTADIPFPAADTDELRELSSCGYMGCQLEVEAPTNTPSSSSLPSVIASFYSIGIVGLLSQYLVY